MPSSSSNSAFAALRHAPEGGRARRVAPAAGAAIGAIWAIGGITVLGCSGGDGASATYTLRFPSTEAAIVTDDVVVQVYDASSGPGVCQDLVLKRLTQQSLPEPLVDAPELSVCDAVSSPSAHALAIPHGARAVLAVARRGGADFLVGCAEVTAADAAFDVPITLSLVSGAVPPPETACASLAQRCAGGC